MKDPRDIRLDIPETRLPFINTEIAELEIQGDRCLVSSIWGGAAGGRLFFWNPDSGACLQRRLPRGIPGAYMLKEGPEGKLYLGCGNGDLMRYAPQDDAFETLVTGALRSITWAGCIAGRYVVWAASPGDVAVYDIERRTLVKVFRPLDGANPSALYGHTLAATPDGKVLAGMSIPEPRLILVDLATMKVASQVTVSSSSGRYLYDMAFIAPDRFGVILGSEFLLFRYPDMTLMQRVAAPAGTQRLRGSYCPRSGRMYAVAEPSDELLVLDPGRHSFERVAQQWSGDCLGASGAWQGRAFCAVTVAGTALYYDAGTRQTKRHELPASGRLPAHAMCVNPQAGTILGAPFINQRFWRMDAATGAGADCGRAAPGRGQVNQILWDPQTSRFLMSSYTTCSVTAYDTSRPAGWPDNPHLLASAHEHGQMRPKAMVHDGTHVWLASSPKYGTLGGALSRIDPVTGEIKVWRHLVPDQTIHALVADPARKRIYCSSDIHADGHSTPPTASSARLVSFSTETLTVLRCDTPVRDSPFVRVFGLLEDGWVLAWESQRLFAWDPDTGAVRQLGDSPPGLRSVLSWQRGIGMIFAAADAISRVDLDRGTLRYRTLIPEAGHSLQVAQGRLWYATETQVCALDLASRGWR